MDFDDVLTSVGGAGKYQVLGYVLIGLTVMPAGMHHLGNVFISGTPEFYCSEPFETKMSEQNRESLRKELRSWSSGDNKDLGTCKIYDINYSGLDWTDLIQDFGSDYKANWTDIRDCKEWKYDMDVYGKTIVTEVGIKNNSLERTVVYV